MSRPPTDDARGGDTISHYRLLGRIGSGGMGVVYKAEDLKLGRLVALKFVSEELAGHGDMRQRFEREARAASALNHPNICTIYEIDEAEGRLFLAMECLEGQSLQESLRGGARPFDEVLRIGIDVAGALQAAHSRGICHRDIKPANIFITSEGTPKLLDFGLAKVRESAATDDQQVTEMVSSPGLIVGTAQYMSPEQAVGTPLDARTDIFSLGLVLYEMATGQQAFSGTTGTVLHAIITRQTPAPSLVSPNLPRQFDEIVAKALEKDREVRYQSAAELRADLKRLTRDIETSSRSSIQPAVPPPRRWSARSVAVAAVLALLAVGAFAIGGMLWWTPRDGFPLEGVMFSQVTGQAGIEHFPSLSPDGNTLVYAGLKEGRYDIFLQRVDGQRPINLTADSSETDTQPVFSPEGDRIAFRSERDAGGLFMMGATGESVRRVSDAGYNPTWSPDGRSLAYATESVDTAHSRMGLSSLWVVDVATGQRRKLSEDDAVQPSWSPNGHRIAYWTVGDRARRDIRTIPAEGGAPVAVTDDASTDWSPAWSPDGRYLFFASDRGGSMNLWRVRIEEQTGRTLGAPEPVTTPSVNSGQITISRDGSRLAYVSQSFARNIARIPFDMEKREAGDAITPVVQGTRFLRFPSVSPDGASIAYTSEEKIFVAPSDGSSPTQLTEGAEFRDRAPRWSNDGKRIAFYSDRSGSYEIWTIERDGGSLTQVTEQRDSTLFYPVWSPEGRRIAYGSLDARSAHLLEVGVPWSRQRPVLLPSPPAAGTVFAPWSWSARAGLAGWALAADGQSLGILIWDPAAGTMRQVTTFGVRPVWLPDDRHFIALHGNRLFVADVRDGSSRWIATPQSLEEDFAVSPDGRWIYFVDDRKEGDIWLATLPAGRRIQE